MVRCLLAKGFRRRTSRFWKRALERLAGHSSPRDFPKYGYLLESDGAAVGAVLLISSLVRAGEDWVIRCNPSSWYVEPPFRTYASLLSAQVLKHRQATYLNVSAAPCTRPIAEAQGFSRYSNGQFVAVAVPKLRSAGWVRVASAGAEPGAHLEPFERDLLDAHSRYGCLSVVCITPQRAVPFVFRPLLAKGVLPCARLIYCRDIEDFVEFAPALGTFLLRHGRPLVFIDSNGPIRGLAGVYLEGVGPKYFRGPSPPRLGDLAYTEAAMFGV